MLPRSLLWTGTLPEYEVKYCGIALKSCRSRIFAVRMRAQVCLPVHLGLNETIGVTFIGFVLGTMCVTPSVSLCLIYRKTKSNIVVVSIDCSE